MSRIFSIAPLFSAYNLDVYKRQRVLGSLAAHQRAVGLHAPLSHTLDDLCDLLGHVAAAGDVIQEDVYKRQVVDRHILLAGQLAVHKAGDGVPLPVIAEIQ